MDKKYIELFKTLAQATAVTAEQVMEYDKSKDDTKGLEAATTMRDNYQELVGHFTDEYQMTRSDAIQLLVGALVQVNQLNDRINNLKKALTGYQSDVVPKLQEIVDKTSNDEEAAKIANEKFIVEDNN